MKDFIANMGAQPALFHLTITILFVLLLECAFRYRELRYCIAGIVYLSIGLWYYIDPFFRSEAYQGFGSSEITIAYAQIAEFLLCFRFMIASLAPASPSTLLRSFSTDGVAIWSTVRILLAVWLTLFLIGMARTDFSLQTLFPVNSRAAWSEHMWYRPRIGGSMSFLISICEYIYQLSCASFGFIAVISKSNRIRALMLGLILLTWPMFFLSGARHHILMVCMPALLAFLLSNRYSSYFKVAITLVVFIALNLTMLVVIQSRNTGFNLSAARDLVFGNDTDASHEGLNMFEELLFINRYQRSGALPIEFGWNYLAHALNFIPRGIWPDKPFPGEAFAALRVGYHQGHLAATISQGIVGQGVTNFGTWLGPIAPAIMLALLARWACRYPLNGNRFARVAVVLMLIGTIPSMGRDITMMYLWPVAFGVFLCYLLEKGVRIPP